MPILPSGLTIGIGYQAIPASVGPNWFKCPEGHFWYKRPDVSITPPPYDGTTQILEDWVHAPVPKTIEEVKQYVYVLYRREDGMFQWRGEWLSEFPKPGHLEAEDETAWKAWIEGDIGISNLQKIIGVCQHQAELNKNCSGYAVFSGNPK
jgi:hypothetical protein